MLEYNRNIFMIKEKEVSEGRLFNIFFGSNNNIIYVVNEEEIFIGIITSESFLNCLRNGKKEGFINRNCQIIYLDKERDVLKKASKLFYQYQITTGIPVLSKENKICFEIREKGECNKNKEEEIKNEIEKFYDKLENHRKSYYLQNEVKCLYKLLETQDIIILGSQKEFDEVLGKLFCNRDRVTIVEDLEDAYKFFYYNSNLVIDVSLKMPLTRESIYWNSCNGYSWKKFFDLIILMLESEYCSRYYEILENRIVTLKEWMKKYSDGKLCFSSWSIITSNLKKYFEKNSFDVIEEIGIFRQPSPQYHLKANGVICEHNKLINDCLLIDTVDFIRQFYFLNKKIEKQVNILNFTFDSEAWLSDIEKEWMEKGFELNEYILNSKKNKNSNSLYSKQNTELEYLKEPERFTIFGNTRRFENDIVVFKEYESEKINIENGIRKTCYLPKEYEGTIYFFGVCTIYGGYVEDAYTIPSLVQQSINRSGLKYRTINLGNGNPRGYLRLIETLNFHKQDILVVLFPFMVDKVKREISAIEIGEKFNQIKITELKNENCFMDAVYHCGDNGNKIYTRIIYDELKKIIKNTGCNELYKDNIYSIFRKNETDLRILYQWDDYVKKLKFANKIIQEKGKIGCVVINCNPFTLGHRYLIEYALEKVRYLFIFVVEEDRSFFPFEERFEMVKRGTEDLENVVVLKSGKCIASAETFPSYFQRQEMNKRKEFLGHEDLRIFGQYIVPILNIQYRFVGEELEDYVTSQYNLAMKKILPKFGVKVIEIERKLKQGEIISASNVRKYYNNGELEKLKELVPESTFDYLLANKRIISE